MDLLSASQWFNPDYYGTDWLASFAGLIGMYFLSNHKRQGFLFNMAGILLGTVFAVLAKSSPLVLVNIIAFGLNFRGFIKWKKISGAPQEFSEIIKAIE